MRYFCEHSTLTHAYIYMYNNINRSDRYGFFIDKEFNKILVPIYIHVMIVIS